MLQPMVSTIDDRAHVAARRESLLQGKLFRGELFKFLLEGALKLVGAPSVQCAGKSDHCVLYRYLQFNRLTTHMRGALLLGAPLDAEVRLRF